MICNAGKPDIATFVTTLHLPRCQCQFFQKNESRKATTFSFHGNISFISKQRAKRFALQYLRAIFRQFYCSDFRPSVTRWMTLIYLLPLACLRFLPFTAVRSSWTPILTLFSSPGSYAHCHESLGGGWLLFGKTTSWILFLRNRHPQLSRLKKATHNAVFVRPVAVNLHPHPPRYRNKHPFPPVWGEFKAPLTV